MSLLVRTKSYDRRDFEIQFRRQYANNQCPARHIYVTTDSWEPIARLKTLKVPHHHHHRQQDNRRSLHVLLFRTKSGMFEEVGYLVPEDDFELSSMSIDFEFVPVSKFRQREQMDAELQCTCQTTKSSASASEEEEEKCDNKTLSQSPSNWITGVATTVFNLSRPFLPPPPRLSEYEAFKTSIQWRMAQFEAAADDWQWNPELDRMSLGAWKHMVSGCGGPIAQRCWHERERELLRRRMDYLHSHELRLLLQEAGRCWGAECVAGSDVPHRDLVQFVWDPELEKQSTDVVQEEWMRVAWSRLTGYSSKPLDNVDPATEFWYFPTHQLGRFFFAVWSLALHRTFAQQTSIATTNVAKLVHRLFTDVPQLRTKLQQWMCWPEVDHKQQQQQQQLKPAVPTVHRRLLRQRDMVFSNARPRTTYLPNVNWDGLVPKVPAAADLRQFLERHCRIRWKEDEEEDMGDRKQELPTMTAFAGEPRPGKFRFLFEKDDDRFCEFVHLARTAPQGCNYLSLVKARIGGFALDFDYVPTDDARWLDIVASGILDLICRVVRTWCPQLSAADVQAVVLSGCGSSKNKAKTSYLIIFDGPSTAGKWQRHCRMAIHIRRELALEFGMDIARAVDLAVYRTNPTHRMLFHDKHEWQTCDACAMKDDEKKKKGVCPTRACQLVDANRPLVPFAVFPLDKANTMMQDGRRLALFTRIRLRSGTPAQTFVPPAICEFPLGRFFEQAQPVHGTNSAGSSSSIITGFSGRNPWKDGVRVTDATHLDSVIQILIPLVGDHVKLNHLKVLDDSPVDKVGVVYKTYVGECKKGTAKCVLLKQGQVHDDNCTMFRLGRTFIAISDYKCVKNLPKGSNWKRFDWNNADAQRILFS